MVLTFVQSLAGLIIVFGSAIPLGYLIIARAFNGKFENHLFILRVPLYITTGLAVVFCIILASSLLFLTFLPLAFIVLAVLFYLFYQWHKDGVLKRPLSFQWRPTTLRTLIPTVLFIGCFIYFAFIASYIRWPSPGDPYNHGVLVSLFLTNMRLPSTYFPLSNEVIQYPLGYHAVSALLALHLRIYPAEALLLFGSIIVSLISPLLYSAIYLKTKSIPFSSIGFLAGFIIHPTGYATKWLLGYYYNGTYPVLVGFIFLLLFIILISELPKAGESTKGNILPLLVFGVVIIGTLLVYPSFIYLIGTFLLVWYACSFFAILMSPEKRKQWVLQNRLMLYLLLGLVITTIIIAFLFRVTIFQILTSIRQALASSELIYYHIDPSFFFDNPNGWILLLAIFPSIGMVFGRQKTHRNIGIAYLLYFIPLLLSLHPVLYDAGLMILLPERALLALVLIAWVLISITCYLGFNHLLSRHAITSAQSDYQQSIGVQSKRGIYSKTAAVLILLVFFPSYAPHLTLFAPRAFSWLSFSTTFDSDYQTSVWIVETLPDHALILNDLSFHGLFLTCYRIQNVIYTYHGNYSRGIICRQFWESPENETLIREILFTYQIEYVYSTASPYYFNSWRFGGNETTVQKPYMPDEYIAILDAYLFLTKLVQYGNSAIYQVETSLLLC